MYIEELFIRYLPLSYGVYLKYLKNSRKAREAVIQFFDVLPNKIASYEIDVFRSWIYDMVKEHCLQILKEEGKQSEMVDFDDFDDFDEDITEFDDRMSRLEEKRGKQTTSLMNLLEVQEGNITFIYK